jgi:hypothetical protein
VGFVVEKMSLGHDVMLYFDFPRQLYQRLLHIPYHSPSGSVSVGQMMARVTFVYRSTARQEINSPINGVKES